MKIFTVFSLLLFLLAGNATAQQASRDTLAERGVSPGGAFLRSLLIPGWGQYSVGAKKRAGVFFALQSASYYMLVKTLNKLGDAQDYEETRIGEVEDSLRAQMAADTAFNRKLSVDSVFQEQLNADSALVDVRRLIDSRKEQRQDWIAYTLFTTLASGLDAYIAAHLADFPAAISARPRPDGSTQLRVTVPLPRRP